MGFPAVIVDKSRISGVSVTPTTQKLFGAKVSVKGDSARMPYSADDHNVRVDVRVESGPLQGRTFPLPIDMLTMADHHRAEILRGALGNVMEEVQHDHCGSHRI